MSDKSAIEWTESTWNPVRGCIKVSPGCAHCYAETFAERFRGVPGHAYEQGFDLRLVPEKLDEPLRRQKPTTYFVNSMSDLFQDGVPDEFIDRVFAVMALAPQHTFQVLTKRAGRMQQYFRLLEDSNGLTREERVEQAADWIREQVGVNAPNGYEVSAKFRRAAAALASFTWPLPNVWLGVSVENQHFADERIPLLLQTPAAVRFISAEPLLGPVKLDPFLPWKFDTFPMHIDSQGRGYNSNRDLPNRLDWVIDGAESGHGARDYRIDWSLSLQRQCAAAGVAYFRKQVGHRPIVSDLTHWRGPAGLLPDSSGYRLTMHSKKGGDPAEWPEDLRVRQFPARGRR